MLPDRFIREDRQEGKGREKFTMFRTVESGIWGAMIRDVDKL